MVDALIGGFGILRRLRSGGNRNGRNGQRTARPPLDSTFGHLQRNYFVLFFVPFTAGGIVGGVFGWGASIVGLVAEDARSPTEIDADEHSAESRSRLSSQSCQLRHDCDDRYTGGPQQNQHDRPVAASRA